MPKVIRDVQIDRFLAMALRKTSAPWPDEWREEAVARTVVERVNYHGITGLLVHGVHHLIDWPDDVIRLLRQQAVAHAMWEIRHKLIVAELLTCLAREEVVAIVLKGTALAYDLYEEPATRVRGDTDILIAREDLGRARAGLHQMGFRLNQKCSVGAEDLRLQEVWQLVSVDGLSHEIDLHWQALNSPALREAFSFADSSAHFLRLPRLCDSAMGMSRVNALLYTCMHRATHIVSPYFADGVTYYGGDRLIWAQDLHLLATALSDQQWARLCDVALGKGLADICLDGLNMARARLGTTIPASVVEMLGSAPKGSKVSTYLLTSGQMRRAWMDLRAVPGLRRKVRYILARVFPSRAFLRAKYPDMRDHPSAFLYLRRVSGFMRKRPERSDS